MARIKENIKIRLIPGRQPDDRFSLNYLKLNAYFSGRSIATVDAIRPEGDTAKAEDGKQWRYGVEAEAGQSGGRRALR